MATVASSLRGALRCMEGAAFMAGEGQLRSHPFAGISLRVGSLGPPAAGAAPARRPLGCWWPCWPNWGPSSLQRTGRWSSAPSPSTGAARSRLRCATTTPCTWARIVASSRRAGFGRSSLGRRPRGPRPCPSLRQPPAGWWTAAGSHGGGRPSSKPPRGGGATCSPGCRGTPRRVPSRDASRARPRPRCCAGGSCWSCGSLSKAPVGDGGRATPTSHLLAPGTDGY